MYSRKSAGLRIEPWGTQGIYSIFLWRLPIQNHPKPSITAKRINKTKYLTWKSIRLKFAKKPPCQTLPKDLELTATVVPHPLKNPGNSIRYNCQKICSWSRRPKTILEIRPHFCRWSTLFTIFERLY